MGSRSVSGLSNSVSTLSIKASHAAYRNEWKTANARITFDRILASVGEGEFNAGTGIFKCGQAGTYSVSWNCTNYVDGGEKTQYNWIWLYRNGSRDADSLHKSYNASGNKTISDNGG